jgi:hypothetical protein
MRRALPTALALLAAACALAQPRSEGWWQARAEEVLTREWSAAPALPWLAGRPTVRVESSAALSAEARKTAPFADDRFGVLVVLTTGLLEAVAANDPAALAGVLGHELAHVTLGHHRAAVQQDRRDRGREDFILGRAASRADELAADREGARLAARAGFDPAGLARALMRARAALGEAGTWSPCAGEHPSLTERLAALDAARAELWRAAAQFEVGVDLIRCGNFPCAAAAFRAARTLFPQSPEVLGNLAYALLRQVELGLGADHWQALGIGRPVPAGFASFLPVPMPPQVRGPEDLERLRRLWAEGADALRAALEADPSDALASANLVYAHLVAVDGPELASTAEALAGARARESNATRWSLAVNAALLAALQGDAEQAVAMLRALPPAPDGLPAHLRAAPEASLALLLARSDRVEDQAQAVAHIERLLPRLPVTSPDSALLAPRLDALRRSLGGGTRTLGTPAQAHQWAAHLRVGTGALYLGADLAAVVRALGSPEAVVPLGDADLASWRYPSRGLELTCFGGLVVRLLVGPPDGTAPLQVQVTDEGRAVLTVAPGDAVARLEKALPAYDAALRMGDGRPYRLYSQARLAARVDSGRIQSLALVAPPS